MKTIKLLSFLLMASLSTHCQKNNPKTADSPVDAPSNPSAMEQRSYRESNAVILNPERGFFTHRDFSTSNIDALSLNRIQKLRAEGISLVFCIYYLKDFRNKPISEAFLARIRNNMEVIRQGGNKAILRFAYTSSREEKPWDAPWQLTQRHIEQLKPILQEYSDVIALMEAGFVGVWGEWHYTDNYIYKPKDDQYEPRRKVLSALLETLPTDRMVAVRTPKAKLSSQKISPKDSLTLSTAFQGSTLARIAAHNDCFLADADDMNTFHREEYRAFWKTESQYVAMGGETCAPSSFAECANSLEMLRQYHWSYLNRDYHKGVLQQWENSKCLDEVKKRLGYRFSLTKGYFTKNPTIGGGYQIELHLKNTGWASPFNPRKVQIIMASQQNPAEKYFLTLKEDPRYWFAGKTIVLKTAFILPTTIEKGKYDIYLNLPDPCPTLTKRKEYSIQLANENVWNEAWGYNKIQEIELNDKAVTEQKGLPTLEKLTE